MHTSTVHAVAMAAAAAKTRPVSKKRTGVIWAPASRLVSGAWCCIATSQTVAVSSTRLHRADKTKSDRPRAITSTRPYISLPPPSTTALLRSPSHTHTKSSVTRTLQICQEENPEERLLLPRLLSHDPLRLVSPSRSVVFTDFCERETTLSEWELVLQSTLLPSWNTLRLRFSSWPETLLGITRRRESFHDTCSSLFEMTRNSTSCSDP